MISEAAKMKDMMQIEAGQKLLEFGSGKHEANREKCKEYCSGKKWDTQKNSWNVVALRKWKAQISTLKCTFAVYLQNFLYYLAVNSIWI